MTTLRRTFLALAASVLALNASAEVFRCTDSAGKVEYRDAQCDRASVSRRLDVVPPGPGIEAEANRAQVAREAAEFNARFYEARRQPATVYYYSEAFVERELAEPMYYGWAGPVCNGSKGCGAKDRPLRQVRRNDRPRAAPTPRPLPVR